MKKIILVDDEKKMLDLLALFIENDQYSCQKFKSGKEAIHYLKNHSADLMLLDVMMPDLNGWETSKIIRTFSNIPIIFLTARSDKDEIVKGLRTGADDYITKPFDEDILLARMEALLRRSENKHQQHVFYCEGLKLDLSSYEVFVNDKSINFTPKEISLIAHFLEKKDKVLSREYLLLSIWGYSTHTEDRTVDSHIRNLREKLRQAGFPVDSYLQTVWGAGYKWTSIPSKP
ncbi:response regulator transcription factor [Bacillus sp. 1P06AnD]|uniref:response regulator transcription factor n=1 Tax=Bacillus sp. 1P06AnD TaxID=3132208 RepID=UPI0039A08095